MPLRLRCVDADGSREVAITPGDLVIAGLTGRDEAAVHHHIEELRAIGVKPPPSVPAFFRNGASLLTTAQAIDALGPDSSGEVEFVLVSLEDGLWVGVGSDHTDRRVEAYAIDVSKQLCPKILGSTVWPIAEVEDHWDELVLRAWVRSGRKRRLYQEASLAAMLPPSELLPGLRRHAGRELAGVVFLSGTVPTLDGELVYGDGYELELADPRLDRKIRTQYTVHVLEGTR